MEIGSSPPPALPPVRGGARKRDLAADGGDAQARQAQQLAEERADELNSEVAALQSENSDTLNHMHQDFDSQEEQERDRQQSALESVRSAGYENLRKTQQSQAAELSRTRRDGEAELARLREFYRNATYQASSKGSRELGNIERRQLEKKNNEDLLMRQRLEQLRQEQDARLRNVHGEGDQRIQQALQQHRDAYQKLVASSKAETGQEQRHFDERYHQLLSEHQKALQRVQAESARNIGELQGEMSRKLAAYRESQADPFYRLVDLDTRFFDEPDRYVLRARVPRQEREHIKVSVLGDRIQLTGFRRNEEKLETEPGHTRSTSSYQSFSEGFPVDWPVDAQRVTREYDGDWMIVTLPKKEHPGPAHFHPLRDNTALPRGEPGRSRTETEPPSAADNPPPSDHRVFEEGPEEA